MVYYSKNLAIFDLLQTAKRVPPSSGHNRFLLRFAPP
jgi:hypothetical protein